MSTCRAASRSGSASATSTRAPCTVRSRRLARREGLALDRADELAELAAENPVGFDDEGRVFIDGRDVTSSIRRPDIDKLVPVVARHHAVREVMRARQRSLGEEETP